VLDALGCIGTAVALFSVVKRQHEGFALGFVTTRMFEAAVIVIGVVCIMAVVTLRQTGAAGADAASLVAVGRALVAVHDVTFLLGPGLMPAFNAALLVT
jgi:Ca2+/Na+ antiporter